MHKTNCELCGNETKAILKDEVIRTVYSNKRKILLKDLPMLECKVCAHQMFTDKTYEIIKVTKEHVRKEIRFKKRKKLA